MYKFFILCSPLTSHWIVFCDSRVCAILAGRNCWIFKLHVHYFIYLKIDSNILRGNECNCDLLIHQSIDFLNTFQLLCTSSFSFLGIKILIVNGGTSSLGPFGYQRSCIDSVNHLNRIFGHTWNSFSVNPAYGASMLFSLGKHFGLFSAAVQSVFGNISVCFRLHFDHCDSNVGYQRSNILLIWVVSITYWDVAVVFVLIYESWPLS